MWLAILFVVNTSQELHLLSPSGASTTMASLIGACCETEWFGEQKEMGKSEVVKDLAIHNKSSNKAKAISSRVSMKRAARIIFFLL